MGRRQTGPERLRSSESGSRSGVTVRRLWRHPQYLGVLSIFCTSTTSHLISCTSHQPLTPGSTSSQLSSPRQPSSTTSYQPSPPSTHYNTFEKRTATLAKQRSWGIPPDPPLFFSQR
ncbi:hypothetical protein BP00DRAFT_88159 [Aspergillus indologenus CBS 114.80]|uniref:Uncharacterized protein n=1 Tax=Aspergillus indologenus CBS 114.80 TaxID=1450541 RepID=A0A2V5IYV2_9EURO|nr:hypothetical protein BP00DRAFT_88159 [Aspergillus indologenus CBS 114.80]